MKTRVILELGCNHNGSMENARRMIDDAARLGVWAVKFQKRDIESMDDALKLMPRKPENSFGPNYYEHRKALEFTLGQIKDLYLYAKNLGLAAGVTVFDMTSINQMATIPWDFIKLPSHFYTHYAFTRTLLLAQGDYMFFASTGMHTLDEIKEWQYFGRHDVTMYCRSIYPATIDQVRMAEFRALRDALSGNTIGYSSHEEGGEAIPLMVLLGAEYVERHYTLGKNMKGSDHATVSSEYNEIKKIMDDIKKIEESEGGIHDLSEEEKKVRVQYRGF